MKKLIRLWILMAVLLTSSGCLETKLNAPPKVWWGQKGDTAEWEKAKVVMNNYDWAVISQDYVLEH